MTCPLTSMLQIYNWHKMWKIKPHVRVKLLHMDHRAAVCTLYQHLSLFTLSQELSPFPYWKALVVDHICWKFRGRGMGGPTGKAGQVTTHQLVHRPGCGFNTPGCLTQFWAPSTAVLRLHHSGCYSADWDISPIPSPSLPPPSSLRFLLQSLTTLEMYGK